MSTEAQSSLFPETNYSETQNSPIPQMVAKRRGVFPDASTPIEPANSASPKQTEQPLSDKSPSDGIYLKDKEVAKRYSVSKATIWRWADCNPDFPKPIVFSKGVSRWSLEDLLAFEALKKGEAK